MNPQASLDAATIWARWTHSTYDPAPAERRRIARTALEVLHYTPMIDDAQAFYAKLHQLGHAMDIRSAQQLLKSRGSELAEAMVASDKDRGLAPASHTRFGQ